jgi:hypothetical protein
MRRVEKATIQRLESLKRLPRMPKAPKNAKSENRTAQYLSD